MCMEYDVLTRFMIMALVSVIFPFVHGFFRLWVMTDGKSCRFWDNFCNFKGFFVFTCEHTYVLRFFFPQYILAGGDPIMVELDGVG